MNGKYFHEKMATGVFKPIYPVIAQNVLKKSQKTHGTCLDIGGGTGVLSVEIARISELNIINIDKDTESIELAKEYINSHQMSGCVKAVVGNAEQLKIESNSIDLVVSRGSIFFWNDQVKGMQEIYRVLKPGGFAYVGGGMGNYQLNKKIFEQLSTHKVWVKEASQRFRKNLPIHLKLMMRKTHIPNWNMEASQEGTWIIINK